ncbi:hypothetical protein PTTG_31175, partial [Puccinia triticina 1-1 BBBD Race 1]
MTLPLIVLAILSVVGGWVGIPHVISEILPGHPHNIFAEWLSPLIKPLPASGHADATVEWALMGVSMGLAIISAFLAWQFYAVKTDIPGRIAEKIQPVYQIVSKKYLVDELYFGTIVNPLINLSRNLWYYVDVNFIDKTTYLIADMTR